MRISLITIVILLLAACSKSDNFNEYMEVVTKGEKLKFFTVTRQEIETIYLQLEEKGKDGSCAIFAFFPKVGDTENHIEIQYCIEDSKIGLDWVFVGEVKYRDKEKFTRYLFENGYESMFMTMNNVEYLRVTSGDLVSLMDGLMYDIYGVTREDKMELIAGYFDLVGLNYSVDDLYSDFYKKQ